MECINEVLMRSERKMKSEEEKTNFANIFNIFGSCYVNF